MEGSADSTMKRPPRIFVNWLRAPRDISTERTNAWSPPTRAWETLRMGPVCVAAVEAEPMAGVSGPAGLTGGRNLPLVRFLPLRLTNSSLVLTAQGSPLVATRSGRRSL